MNAVRPAASRRLTCLLRVATIMLVAGITLFIALNRDKMEDFSALGYAGAFLAMLLSNATLILPAPGLFIVFALGSSLNPLLVGLAAALGGTLGEMTGYLTGYSGLGVLENVAVTQRINHWMTRNGTLTIFALSIVPNPFFDLAGLMAGAGRMSPWRFMGVAFCGKSIQSTAIALAGTLSLNWVEELIKH